MTLLKKLFGKAEEPKARVRVCVECGMPVAEHEVLVLDPARRSRDEGPLRRRPIGSGLNQPPPGPMDSARVRILPVGVESGRVQVNPRRPRPGVAGRIERRRRRDPSPATLATRCRRRRTTSGSSSRTSTCVSSNTRCDPAERDQWHTHPAKVSVRRRRRDAARQHRGRPAVPGGRKSRDRNLGRSRRTPLRAERRQDDGQHHPDRGQGRIAARHAAAGPSADWRGILGWCVTIQHP